jgi:hypothetical protein
MANFEKLLMVFQWKIKIGRRKQNVCGETKRI